MGTFLLLLGVGVLGYCAYGMSQPQWNRPAIFRQLSGRWLVAAVGASLVLTGIALL
jgi:hypothetical protein